MNDETRSQIADVVAALPPLPAEDRERIAALLGDAVPTREVDVVGDLGEAS